MKALHFLLLLLFLPINIILANNILFTAEQETDYVYFGDFLRAQIALETTEKLDVPPQPKVVNNSNDYSIEISKAPYVSQSFFSQYINGKRITENNYTYSWNTKISPNSTNAIEAIKFEINVNGKNYSAQLKPITVIAPQPSPYASIEFFADKTEIIAEDTFRITASIKLLAISNANKTIPPIFQRATPRLLLPHLDQNFEEIKLAANGVNQLFEYATSNVGIYINNYQVPSPFSIFGDGAQSIFNIPNSIIEENGTNYFVYSWTTIYKAKTPSKITFKPITFVGEILKEAPNNKYDLTDVFIVSDPINITISEPPLEGRPASFIGAISDKLKAETSLDTQNCKEGDPITLTLKLENVENPLSVIPPKLDELDGFKNNFRAFGEIKTTPNEADKNATFEYSIRPITSGTIEVPAIELGYYNLTTNQYATITTIPVPIRVDPAPQVAAIDGSEAVDLPDEVVRYYPTAISFDTSTTSGSISFLIKQLAIISPFIWVVALLLRKILSKRKRLIEYIKNMSATEAAIKRLSNANVPAEVMSAVSTFISKKFKIKTTGSTPDDILKALNEQKISSEIITQLSKPLKRIFDLSFAPNADIPTEVTDAKEKLLPVLQKLKGKSSTLPQICICIGAIVACIAIVVGPIIAAILLSISTTQIEKRTPDEYELRQANLLVNTAISKKDFTAIATNYYTRFSYNFNSSKPIPALLHNYATALTLAGHPQKAIDVIDYIETITGTTKELDNSRLFAMQSLQEQDSLQTEENGISTILESPTLPWYRMPLFWHYQYSISERGNALCIIWTILWVLLIIRIFPTNRKPVNIAIAIAFVAFIFVSSSYLASRELLKKPIPEITAAELLLEQEQTIEEGLPNE